MKTTHTPEPWQYGSTQISGARGISRCYTINKGKDTDTIFDTPHDTPEDEANAARAIQCVNACAGLTAEQVAGLPGMLAEAREVAALVRTIASFTRSTGFNPDDDRDTINSLRAAARKINVDRLLAKLTPADARDNEGVKE